MKTRLLGKCGMAVSEIGLGCWQLGGDFGPLSNESAQQILQAAHECGINFWDTADIYGGGSSEERIAQYVKINIPGTIIATKVGRHANLYPDGYTKEKVRTNIEGSMRRLGVDVLDLVQLHCVPPEVLKAGDLLGWMEDFQSQGLIKAFGASVETLEEAVFAAQHPTLTSVQIIFNIFRQNAIEELFPIAIANDVGIIVRLPLASGVLSGKMTRDQVFDKTDHRYYNRNGESFSQGETFSGIPFEIAVEFVDEIRCRVPTGMSMAQMAMRWILDQPAVTTIIAGASRPEQVRENASVSDLPPLSADLHQELTNFYQRQVETSIRVPI